MEKEKASEVQRAMVTALAAWVGGNHEKAIEAMADILGYCKTHLRTGRRIPGLHVGTRQGCMVIGGGMNGMQLDTSGLKVRGGKKPGPTPGRCAECGAMLLTVGDAVACSRCGTEVEGVAPPEYQRPARDDRPARAPAPRPPHVRPTPGLFAYEARGVRPGPPIRQSGPRRAFLPMGGMGGPEEFARGTAAGGDGPKAPPKPMDALPVEHEPPCPKCGHGAHNERDCVRCDCTHQKGEPFPPVASAAAPDGPELFFPEDPSGDDLPEFP